MEELFHIGGPTGLQEISDETLNRRLNEVEREALERAAGSDATAEYFGLWGKKPESK